MRPPQSNATGAKGSPPAAGAARAAEPSQIALQHTLNASLARYKNAMAALTSVPPGTVASNERKALIDRFVRLESTAEGLQGQIDELGASPQMSAVEGLMDTLKDFQSSVLAFVQAVREEVQGSVPMGSAPLGQTAPESAPKKRPWLKWSLIGAGLAAGGYLGWRLYRAR